jgi:hypothetical protein
MVSPKIVGATVSPVDSVSILLPVLNPPMEYELLVQDWYCVSVKRIHGLFKPLATARATKGSTKGLGLCIARELALD